MVKYVELNNRKFMSFRIRVLIEEHKKALCLLRDDKIIIEKINNHGSKVGCYTFEEVDNN